MGLFHHKNLQPEFLDHGAASAYDSITLRGLDSLLQIDPTFSADELKASVSELYIRLIFAWQKKELKPVIPYLTAETAAVYQKQLEPYLAEGASYCYDRPAVLRTELLGWAQADGSQIIRAKLNTRGFIYITNDQTGKLLRGDRNTDQFREYLWTLIRPDTLGTPVRPKLSAVNCPNCGGNADVDRTNICPYCGTVLVYGGMNWKLCSSAGHKKHP